MGLLTLCHMVIFIALLCSSFSVSVTFELRSLHTNAVLTTSAHAEQAQFYQKSESFGVAVTSTNDDANAVFTLQVSAPVRYGWAAVGTGDRMDNSLMFIVYPSQTEGETGLSLASLWSL
jgi:hypothetical protein